MKRYTVYFFLIPLIPFFFSCSEKQTGVTQKDVLQSIFTHDWQPGVNAFQIATADFVTQVQTFRDNPTSNGYLAVSQSWKNTFLKFKEIEVYNIVAVKNTFLYTSIQRSPCNTAFLQEIISDTAKLTVERVNSFGSTSKGLTSLEYLLFAQQDGFSGLSVFNQHPKANRYLDLLVALASNLNITSGKLQEAVAGYATEFQSNLSVDHTGSLNQLFNAQLELLESIQKIRLNKALHLDGSLEPDSSLFECSYKDVNAALISEALKGVQESFSTPKGLYAYIDHRQEQLQATGLTTDIKAQFEKCFALLKNNTGFSKNWQSQQQDFIQLNEELKTLFVLLKIDTASLLNIRLTISDNDGD